MAFVGISFIVVLTGILTAYWVFVVRPEEQVQQAFWRRVKKGAPVSIGIRSNLLKQAQRLSAVPSIDAALQRSHHVLRPIELLIEQSGNRMTVGAFVLGSVTCGVITAAVAMKFTGLAILALVLALPAAWAPTSVLRF